MKKEIVILLEDEYRINTLFQSFKKYSIQEILIFFAHKKKEKSFLNLFYYYLWIFREDDTCTQILNNKSFQAEYVVQFIYQSFGLWISGGRDPDSFFKEIIQYISKEKSIQILIETELLNLDLTLSIHLISLLNIETVEYVFEKSPASSGIKSFVKEIFNEIEIHSIKQIFEKNFELYSYFLEHLPTEYSIKYKKKYAEVYEDFALISIAMQISELIKKKFSSEEDCSQVDKPDYVNTQRIELLICQLSESVKYKEILHLLQTRTQTITASEMDITNFALSTPFLKREIIKKLKSRGLMV